MTIELKPEQERILHALLQQGRFRSVDEAVETALHLLVIDKEAELRADPRRRTPIEAAEHMRKLRRGNKLPQGMTIRDMIHEGRA